MGICRLYIVIGCLNIVRYPLSRFLGRRKAPPRIMAENIVDDIYIYLSLKFRTLSVIAISGKAQGSPRIMTGNIFAEYIRIFVVEMLYVIRYRDFWEGARLSINPSRTRL